MKAHRDAIQFLFIKYVSGSSVGAVEVRAARAIERG